MKPDASKETRTPVLSITGKSMKLLKEGQMIHENSQLIELLQELLNGRISMKNPNRRIAVSASMYVEDHETFGSNETISRQKTNSAILSSQGIAQTVMDFEVRMGGEIRVEFTIIASLFDTNGNAMIDGEVKLYEGDSESTGDLDGEKQFQLYVPAGATVNYFVRVDNDDEGGDYATIDLNVTNASV